MSTWTCVKDPIESGGHRTPHCPLCVCDLWVFIPLYYMLYDNNNNNNKSTTSWSNVFACIRNGLVRSSIDEIGEIAAHIGLETPKWTVRANISTMCLLLWIFSILPSNIRSHIGNRHTSPYCTVYTHHIRYTGPDQTVETEIIVVSCRRTTYSIGTTLLNRSNHLNSCFLDSIHPYCLQNMPRG